MAYKGYHVMPIVNISVKQLEQKFNKTVIGILNRHNIDKSNRIRNY